MVDQIDMAPIEVLPLPILLSKLNLAKNVFENMSVEKSKAKAEKLKSQTNELVHLENTLQQLELNFDRATNTKNEYEKKIEVEKQTYKLKEAEIANTRTFSATKNREALQTKREKLRLLLKKKKASLEESGYLNKKHKESAVVELDAVMKVTGLEIISLTGHEMKFIFNNISETDPNKTSYMVIHLDENSKYNEIECQPNLPQMSTYLDGLNHDRDLYYFVKLVRASFVELANPA